MQPHPTKICLVGIPKTCTRKDLCSYMKSLFPSACFSIALKASKNKANYGWATLVTKSKEFYQAVLDFGKFSLEGKTFFAKKFMNRKKLQKFRKEFERRKVFVNKIPLHVNNC